MLSSPSQGRSEVLFDERIVRLDFRCRLEHDFGFLVAFKLGKRNADGDGSVVVARAEVEASAEFGMQLESGTRFESGPGS